MIKLKYDEKNIYNYSNYHNVWFCIKFM